MAKYLYEIDRLQQNYPLQITRGRVEGGAPFGAYGKKITTAAYSGVLWSDGAFAFPAATGTTVDFVSTSANDSATGTGIRVVRLRYLDVNLETKFEDITLNGTGVVSTVANDIRYINGMLAVAWGSGKSAAGTITAYSTAGNHSTIAVGELRCSCSVRTVPAGERLVINSVSGGSISGTAAARTVLELGVTNYFGVDYSVDNILIPYMAGVFQDGSASFPLNAPVSFTAGTSIGLLCTCDKAATIVGAYHGWIEPE